MARLRNAIELGERLFNGFLLNPSARKVGLEVKHQNKVAFYMSANCYANIFSLALPLSRDSARSEEQQFHIQTI